jgi:predicted nucleic-acid-binding protein
MWADTNILVRLVTQNPTTQFKAVQTYLQTVNGTVKVHSAHICEALYVLEGQVYQFTTTRAAQELELILSASCFEVIDAIAVIKALRAYPASNLDFPDVLLCELARAEASEVLTFDKKMARLGVTIQIP